MILLNSFIFFLKDLEMYLYNVILIKMVVYGYKNFMKFIFVLCVIKNWLSLRF